MALTRYHTRDTPAGRNAVRVVRTWPGGPPRGHVFEPVASLRGHLLRLGMVEEVPVQVKRKRRTKAQMQADALAE
jgi:hypothetical protein